MATPVVMVLPDDLGGSPTLVEGRVGDDSPASRISGDGVTQGGVQVINRPVGTVS